jgi:hypothetical protein
LDTQEILENQDLEIQESETQESETRELETQEALGTVLAKVFHQTTP